MNTVSFSRQVILLVFLLYVQALTKIKSLFINVEMKLQQRLSEVKEKVTYCMNTPDFRTKHTHGWMKAFFSIFVRP